MEKSLQLVIAATVVIFCAFILLVVGTGSTGWVYIGGISLEQGLMNRYPADSASDSKVQAAYAMCIIGCLAVSTALVAIVVHLILLLLKKSSDKLTFIFLLITVIAAVVSGVFGIIGAIIHIAWSADYFKKGSPYNYANAYAINYGVYSGTTNSTNYSPGYSFFLVIIGAIVAIIGGVIAYKSKKGGLIGGN